MKLWRREAQREAASIDPKTGRPHGRAPRGLNKRLAARAHSNPLRTTAFPSALLQTLFKRAGIALHGEEKTGG